MDNFVKVLGGSLSTILSRGKILESINKVPIFQQLPQTKKNLLIQTLKKQKIENGKAIINQDEEGSRFYIVKKGKVDIFINKQYQRTLNKHEYFGERALFFKEPRSATAIANGSVTLYVLEKDNFQNILDENLKNYLVNHLYLQDNSIELKNLTVIKPLGNGSYGYVILVQLDKNNFKYALKAVSKKQIDYEKMHKNFEMERKILLQVDHPFIVKLVKSLKDSKYIYFLMEYVQGQELFDVIREIGLLNKKQNVFYGSSIMLALDYLHSRKFIYRDIKPENIMVLDNVRIVLNLSNITYYRGTLNLLTLVLQSISSIEQLQLLEPLTIWLPRLFTVRVTLSQLIFGQLPYVCMNLFAEVYHLEKMKKTQ